MQQPLYSSVTCPITDVLTVVSAKWTVEILRELCIQPTRTRRFLAHVPGLTMKSLRQRLMQLEQLGFVNRHQFDERPLKVEYKITDKGRKLFDLLLAIKALADDLGEKICNCPFESATAEGCGEFSCPLRKQLRFR
jgi:DNA-binding HxlR family transcriptional regulator